jgi:uracil-DNA glycosylase
MKLPELESEMEEALRLQLAFYRDIGVKEIYKRKRSAAKPASARVEPGVETRMAAGVEAKPTLGSKPVLGAKPTLGSKATTPEIQPGIAGVPPAKPSGLAPIASLLPSELPPLAAADDTLLKIQQDIGDCRRCRLCEQRSKIVFGSGKETASLVFVGEGPGADEDAQGFPFVGRAGQLLTQMIDGTANKEGIPIQRPDVYICNVVKCRPPENRTPQPDEMEICGQFLFRQLMAIRPKAICALGSTAAKALLATKDGVTRLRGKWHKWHDIPVMVTYHPSYLLRPYNQEAKREAWEDLKKVLHFVYD